MTKLLPCPFCGSDIVGLSRLGYVIKCHVCHAYGPDVDSPESAIEQWNTRTPTPPPPPDAPDAANVPVGDGNQVTQ